MTQREKPIELLNEHHSGNYKVFNIGFTSQDGPDETQFDIHEDEFDRTHETLFELFHSFLMENELELKSVDYIEEV